MMTSTDNDTEMVEKIKGKENEEYKISKIANDAFSKLTTHDNNGNVPMIFV